MNYARSIVILLSFFSFKLVANENDAHKKTKQSILQSVDRALTGMQAIEKNRPRDMRYVRPIIRKLHAARKEMKDYFSGVALQVEDTSD